MDPVQPDIEKPEDEEEAPAQAANPQPSGGSGFGTNFAKGLTGGGGGGSGAGNGVLASTAKSAINAGITALAASDERVKKDVQPGAPKARGFLDALHAHEYAYKNPQAPGQAPGRFVSPMAQELEKAGPVGKSMVQDTPSGKQVDYRRGLATMLAAQADLHHRLKRLEARQHPHALAAHLKKQA